MRHVANFLDPYCEARLMEAIVKEGKGDIEIREDENDHSPIVFSKKLNRGIHLESIFIQLSVLGKKATVIDRLIYRF